MKKLLSLIGGALIALTVNAAPNPSPVPDEGMWLPIFVKDLNYEQMREMGLQLTADQIYSINHSSLKDAIVNFGDFCTAEVVSDQGLLFTNHHCGYDAIQKHSAIDHDYLTDGFWSNSFEEELPCEGLYAKFFVRMEDITDRVLAKVDDSMSEDEREEVVEAIAEEIEKEASEDGKYHTEVHGLFAGNEYYLFVYKVYRDVRLVGAPPSSIGKFGGDTDNWMWPRHTGDFSVFRVYADENGEPADFAETNKPLTPKRHLEISLDGVQPDDFTMIWGFPGSTERYMTSFGINYNVDSFYPVIYEVFKAETDVMDEYMKVDKAVNIAYADNKAGLANTWKNFEGQMKMLRKNKVAERKAELEAQFTEWVNANEDRKAEYGEVLGTLETMYAQLATTSRTLFYPNFLIQLNPMTRAFEFIEFYQVSTDKGSSKADKQAAAEGLKEINVDEMFKDLDARVEKDMLIAVINIYASKFTTEELPESMQKLLKKYKGDWTALANDLADNSIFSTPESIKAFIEKPNAKKLEKDPAFVMAGALREQVYSVVPVYQMANSAITEANHNFVKGLREFYAETQPNKVLYPDANSTLRMSYGSVKDYQPADAISYDYVCTANGILEKYIPGDFEFDAPKRLLDLIEARDFGQYANDYGELVVCFLSTNDITGGNSGSPIMNGKGELIGLAFDGNWEAMSGDVNFEPTLQRTINVDIRYVLFIIDKFAGATNLIDELDINKAMPEPIRVEEE